MVPAKSAAANNGPGPPLSQLATFVILLPVFGTGTTAGPRLSQPQRVREREPQAKRDVQLGGMRWLGQPRAGLGGSAAATAGRGQYQDVPRSAVQAATRPGLESDGHPLFWWRASISFLP